MSFKFNPLEFKYFLFLLPVSLFTIALPALGVEVILHCFIFFPSLASVMSVDVRFSFRFIAF
jgi:hypothetical protein